MTTTTQQLLDIFVGRGMWGSGDVTIINSNPHIDPRLGVNMPYLIGSKGEEDGRQIRIVIEMLPEVLREAFKAGADLTGCVLVAGTSLFSNSWYAFLMYPKKSTRWEISISKRTGKKRGAPEIRIFEVCGFIEVKEIEKLPLVSLAQLETEARQKWPESALTQARAWFAAWERSKEIAQDGGLLSLLTSKMMGLTGQMVEISFIVEAGLVSFSFCDEFITEAYIADLVDDLDAQRISGEIIRGIAKLMT